MAREKMMNIILNTTEKYQGNKTCLALGTFDGVHTGHRGVISSAVSSGYIPGVFTFSQPPRFEIEKRGNGLITPPLIKQKILDDMGIQLYICLDFQRIRKLSADQFVELLVEKYNAKKLCCGYNFRFGKNGEGTPLMLKQAAKRYGAKIAVLPPVFDLDETVSSSRIRESIINGDLETATRMMGHQFSYNFQVIEGDKRGREIGVPTINQKWPEWFVKPKFGVYLSAVLRKGRWYRSVTNIGIRPTVESQFVSSETHIIGLSENLYTENITVNLIKYLRPEKRFRNFEDLKIQIYKDISDVRNMKI